MIPTCTTAPVDTCFLQIGQEVIPVYGNEQRGWSLEADDLSEGSTRFRYGSLEELFFVLINLNVNAEGTA